MEWVVEGLKAIVSGISTALTLAGLLWLLNWYKNRRLESKIIEAVQKKSRPCGTAAYEKKGAKILSSGIELHNIFDFAFTVRSVWAESGKEGHGRRCQMKYVGIEYQEDIVPIRFANHNPSKFVIVQPFTNGQWELDKECVGTEDHFERLSVHVEYTTFFRTPKVIRINVENSEILKHIKQMIEEKNVVEPAGSASRP